MLILTLCFFSSQGSLSSLLQEIYENFAHQQTCENFYLNGTVEDGMD